jgi:Ca-activated chloride channel family protein
VSSKRTRGGLAGVGLLVAALAVGGPAHAQEGADGERASRGAVELILDASGSMNAADAGGGMTRIEAAREALSTLITELPEGAPVGLRVYGNADTPAAKRRSCDVTDLVQPIEPLDPAGMTARLDEFQPGGKTPIGNALQEAGRDLRDAGQQVIVLVSDGLDTCAPPDPCDVARRLARSGVDLRVQAIGFKTDPKATAALRCIAGATGGTYRDADDAESLADSLLAATLRALRGYEVAGEPVTGGTSPDDPAPIGEGQFIDEIEPDEALWYEVELPAGTGAVSSATLVPPLPRIPVGVASLGGDFGMALYGPVADSGAGGVTEPGAETNTEPDGDEVDSDSKFSLLRELAAGIPVTLSTSTEDLVAEEGRFVFGVALEEKVDPLPPGPYPLEILVDQLGTPVTPEDDEEEPTAPASDADGSDDDSGPGAPAALGVGVGGALIGFVATAIALARRRRS